MVNDPHQDSRDAAATAWHKQAVAAGQTERMLVRAVNGELVSYLPEEYGVARMTYGSPITSAAGNWVMAGLLVALTVGLPVSVTLRLSPSAGTPSPWLWIAPILILLPLAGYFAWQARKESRAVGLRRKRGLPAPTSQTIESKWTRDRPSNGR